MLIEPHLRAFYGCLLCATSGVEVEIEELPEPLCWSFEFWEAHLRRSVTHHHAESAPDCMASRVTRIESYWKFY